jgi:membrane associated rhomboid family serine protease
MLPLKDDNPTERTPVVTIGLIVVNVLVFLWELSLPEYSRTHAMFSLGLIPAALTHHGAPVLHSDVSPQVTLLTSMFLHGGFLHLGGNMLYLWIFGNNVEDVVGSARFLLFYLICGVAAGLAQVFVMPGSHIPQIGASGAIAGVLGAYLVLFPHARVMTLVPLFYFMRVMWLPAVAVLGFWFVLQLFNGVGGLALSRATSADTGGVAFFAHIGGFVAGFLLIRLFAPARRHRAI